MKSKTDKDKQTVCLLFSLRLPQSSNKASHIPGGGQR